MIRKIAAAAAVAAALLAASASPASAQVKPNPGQHSGYTCVRTFPTNGSASYTWCYHKYVVRHRHRHLVWPFLPPKTPTAPAPIAFVPM